MSHYRLWFQLKSNEQPWSGYLDSPHIRTDEQAIDWARRFKETLPEYTVTLRRDEQVIPFETQ